MIEVSALYKKYGKSVILDHLDFKLEEQRIYGFLGPNGAGKTTTMNILTGYLQATGGTVLINGVDIRKKPQKAKKKIGYLPENPPLYQDMTVAEYLRFAAGLKKIPAKQRNDEVRKAIGVMALREYEQTLICSLSKGYRQRVGMAQALLGNPDILILDEPTVGLDPKQMTEFRGLLRKLGKKHTIILSSHILSEVQAVCDEVLMISEGKIVAQGTPEELEERADQTQKICILVKGSEEAVQAACAEVPEIDHAELTEDPGRGRLRYEILAKSGCDIREAVSVALAGHQISILEMTQHKESLEDAFLRLTDMDEAKQAETEDNEKC